MELSKRLQAVADLITPGNRVADIGTDHGYVPIYLVKEKIVSQALALDVNAGPLRHAREHIFREGLEEVIQTRLSDGLSALKPGEADTAVIAGMGGSLTIRILTDAGHVLPFLKELILQPQSEISKVRQYLQDHSCFIEDENIVFEDGKYYPMMKVSIGKRMPPMDVMQLRYGPVLLEKLPECLLDYLRWEQSIKEKVLNQLELSAGFEADARRQEVLRDMEINRKAQELFMSR